ncbi:MAG: alpha/beta hydrolase [Saprospiraceae bacterium]|nr:alpha/beta hydrolase [Saprospiraceae bacterium]
MNRFLLLFAWLICLYATSHAQPSYQPDDLGDGFEKATLQMPDDYEGKVTCTLVRKPIGSLEGGKAVLYVHGFNDYFFQKEMAAQFISHGYRFYAIDLRKYGRSILPNQKMNNLRDLAEYFADLDTALSIMRSEGCTDILLSGHSTGGLTVSLYAQSRLGKEKFDAVFLNSPFFDFNLKGLQKKAIPAVSKKGRKKPDKILKGGVSDIYGKSLYYKDKGEWDYNLTWKPHVSPPVNYGFINAIHQGHETVHKGLTIGKPVLVLRSDNSVYNKKWNDNMLTGDAILNVEHIEEQSRKIKNNCTIKVVKNGMHDLILSPKPVRDEAYRMLFEWLGNR